MPRLAALALRAASDAIRVDLRAGATWAEAHLASTERGAHRAEVTVDTSLGFDEKRHPARGKSPLPPTTIVVVAKPVNGRAA
jgi:hypothetical protein